MKPKPSAPNDMEPNEPLDHWLESAKWPEIEPSRIERIKVRWRQDLQSMEETGTATDSYQDLAEPVIVPNPVQPTCPSGFHNRSVSWRPWTLALICLMGVGFGWHWLMFGKPQVETAARVASKSETVTGDPKPADLGSSTDVRERVVPHEISFSADQGRVLAALARQQVKRKPSLASLALNDEATKRWLVAWVGRSPWLTSRWASFAAQMDDDFQRMFISRSEKDQEIAEDYFRYRSQQQDWLWQAADRSPPIERKAIERVALAGTFRQIFVRIKPFLQDPHWHLDVAQLVARRGTVQEIELVLPRIDHAQGNRLLIERLLDHSDREAVYAFLRLLKDPEMEQTALTAIQWAPQVPVDAWLELIAIQAPEKWHAAMAVGQVCDVDVIQRLTQLAGQMPSMQPALVALLASPCSDAQEFVRFAAHDELLKGPVATARRKLKKLFKKFSNPI